jgi:choline-sulfatase
MPNVLIFMSDEHNPRYSSVHGHPVVQTPNMARLAQEGTVYENAYCPSPLCLPSRSAFMAGNRVHHLQTYSNCNVNLDLSPPSYGAVLAAQGVHTAYVGKTDVYVPGDKLGFEKMMLPGDRRLPGDTNHRRTPLAIRTGSAQRADGYGPRPDGGASDRLKVDAAVEWLTLIAPTLDRPWLLTVNVSNPHFPQYVTPDLWALYPADRLLSAGEDLPAHGPDCASANHPYARDLRDHFECDLFAEEQVRGLRRGYLGCVTFVDRQLGRLLAALEQGGQRETTDVIYTSDHGEMLGKFGMWWKCSLYEDSVRVPCFAAGPSFRAGKRVRTPVDLHDVQAAAFSSLGAERPTDWVGAPLSGIPADNPQRVVFSEYHGHGTRASAYMIRKGKWKYIHYIAAPDQLFDLVADPEELKNVDAAHPAVVAELEQALAEICSPQEENVRAEGFIERQLAELE